MPVDASLKFTTSGEHPAGGVLSAAMPEAAAVDRRSGDGIHERRVVAGTGGDGMPEAGIAAPGRAHHA